MRMAANVINGCGKICTIAQSFTISMRASFVEYLFLKPYPTHQVFVRGLLSR